MTSKLATTSSLSRKKNLHYFGESFIFMNITDHSLCQTLLKFQGLHQNKALFLSHNNITDQGLLTIANQLMYDTTVEHIVLSNNKIQLSCFTQATLKTFFSYNQTIKFFVLNNNKIKNSSLIYLANTLQYNQSIRHIMLSNNQIGDSGFIYFLNKIRTNNIPIESLVLRNNLLTDRSILFLIHYLNQVTSLKKIDITNNQFVHLTNLQTLKYIALKQSINLSYKKQIY